MSYWWIDAILIALIVIYGLVGLSKGFFESILRLISTAAAVGLAVWLARPLSTLVNKVLPLVSWYTKALSSQPDPINLFGQELSHSQVAAFLSIVTTGIVIFLLVKIIIWILAKLFDSATKNNTALSGLNRVLGMFFGIAKGAVVVASALGAISLLSSIPAMQKVESAISSTKVTNWLYKYVDTFVENNINKLNLQEILDKVVNNSGSSEGASSTSSAVITTGTTESGETYTVTVE